MNVGKSKIMRCTRNEDGGRLNVMLNGEALEEVDQFKYLGSVIAANGEGLCNNQISTPSSSAAFIFYYTDTCKC